LRVVEWGGTVVRDAFDENRPRLGPCCGWALENLVET
jgi:hypothetical protein